MSIRIQVPELRPHVSGGHMTEWHYRTTHDYKDIIEAGSDYWMPVVNLIRPLDEIRVQAADGSWEYRLSVRVSDERTRKIVVQMFAISAMKDGVMIFDQDAIDESKRLAASATEREALQKQKYDEMVAELDTEEMQPKVAWRGKSAQWVVIAYNDHIQGGYETKEAATAALEDPGIKQKIEQHREIFLTQNFEARRTARK